MKTAFATFATALILGASLSTPATANISNVFHENMVFPTNFDGFMSDKAKRTAKTRN